jgi:two-component system NtrC family sensor kinase
MVIRNNILSAKFLLTGITRVAFCAVFILSIINALAQPTGDVTSVDSLEQVLTSAPADTARVNLLVRLANIYMITDPDKAIKPASEALSLAKDLGYVDGQLLAMSSLAFAHNIFGEWARGLDLAFQGMQLAKEQKPGFEGLFYSIVAVGYQKQGDYKKILEWTLKPLRSVRKNLDLAHWALALTSSTGFMETGQIDSAFHYALESVDVASRSPLPPAQMGYSLASLANIHVKIKQYDSSLTYFNRAKDLLQQSNHFFAVQEVNRDIARMYKSLDVRDSVRKYATLAFDEASKVRNPLVVRDATAMLADYYETIDKPRAFYFLRLYTTINDSLSTVEKANQVYQLEWEERKKIIELENERQAHQNRIWQNTLIGSLTTVILIAAVIFYNSRQKQKANKLLASQKADLESALINLKSAQARLVQSEKMASLGELTAGIAHEIQNPLNFVNNFSEVSTELIDEMVEEANKGNFEAARRIAIDVKENLDKVSHHGKRADGIVKSMLQHSQSGSGQRELTDINQLCDECLRLSYHGLRAKDKSFNAKFETYFDPTIAKINIVPQEIGRVVLNLVNNAFYAVTEKKKNSPLEFEPTITITTKKHGDKVEISVKDNGTGIPQKVVDKIFQPFFTTKPTGQGTGLGLSLSYDIIKTHGGELKVETREGEGSKFDIHLPA